MYQMRGPAHTEAINYCIDRHIVNDAAQFITQTCAIVIVNSARDVSLVVAREQVMRTELLD